MIHSERVFFPEKFADLHAALAQLAVRGLPAQLTWQAHKIGPESIFDFHLVSIGGLSYRTDDLPVFWLQNLKFLAHMLRIGTYTYLLASSRSLTDITLETTTGNLWLVDLSLCDIALHPNATVREHAETCIKYLNKNSEVFEECFDAFTKTLNQFPYPVRNRPGALQAWTRFDELVRGIDPGSSEHLNSYWQCIIGERLDAFGQGDPDG